VAPQSGHPRRIWPGVLAVASIVPVVVVVLLVLGVHHRPSSRPGRGGSSELRLPSSGSAQTLLLIGSDHRAGEPYRFANTDAMLLLRLDPSASTINVLSVPRDLLVRIPGFGNGKLNSAYGSGGPSALLRILGTQVFPGLKVNHIIDFNFQGFSDLVDALGCVYGDIDHRYINVNDNDTGAGMAQTAYSSIDLQPGYQELCGAQALQFVRFRHSDSDVVRETRQQDFLRWVSESVSLGTVFSTRDRLFKLLGRYAQTDVGLHSTNGLIQLFNLIVNLVGHPINQIPFPAQLRPCSSATCAITATPASEAAAYEQFLSTGTVTASPSARSAPSAASQPRATVHAGSTRVVTAGSAGQAQATALGSPGLPVYYPTVIASGSSYCSTASGNCRAAPNPAGRYANAYPRAYEIRAAGHPYPSYRMTLVLNAALGEYYGVQGTTWSDPPILRHPAHIEVVSGRRLREYGTGDQLSIVAFSTPSGTYWVSNTLTDSIPSSELVAIAASMRPTA
jgi:LCP family protein required for cell wall assembly